MNERIKELAEKADIVFGFDKNGDPEVICTAMDIEIFAKLIVRECSGVVEKNLFESIGWRVSELVKQRFGVKE